MNSVRFHEFGKPAEVLRYEALHLPDLTDGEVRVKMLAAPINPADLNYIEGTYGDKPELPAVAGMEGFGVVEESRSPDFSAGDHVIFLCRAHAWQTHVNVAASGLFRVPRAIDPLQAAMLKVNPATAMRLLQGFATLPKGSWVAQNAANSGVGRCLIQAAKAHGLRTINFVRRPELIDELKELGGDVVLLDSDDGAAQALELTQGERPSLACNAVGGDSALRLMGLLEDLGVHVTYGAMSRRSLKVPNSFLIFKRIELHGLWVTKWLKEDSRENVHAVYRELVDLVMAGKLVQLVDAVYPLENFQDAVRRASESGRNGKVLFAMR